MTRTMVLGLLKKNGPLSGYEIQQMMESSQTDMWAYVNPGSIYHALKKLQEEGKVVLEKVENTGLRTKSFFKITEDGEHELTRLLFDSFSGSSVVFPAKIYTALTFMDNLSKEDIFAALDQQQASVEKLYASLQAGDHAKRSTLGEVSANIQIIFANMYEQCELQLKMIAQIRHLVEEVN